MEQGRAVGQMSTMRRLTQTKQATPPLPPPLHPFFFGYRSLYSLRTGLLPSPPRPSVTPRLSVLSFNPKHPQLCTPTSQVRP